MDIRSILLTLISITITACNINDPEQAAKIFVPDGNADLIRELSNNNIPHRIDSDDKIWFPASYAEQVNKIGARIVAKESPVVSAVIEDPKILANAIEKLQASRINYTLNDDEDGTTITWDDNKAYEGSVIVYEVMFLR